jgi:Gnt-I system low-affinity gluconate transporter
MLGALLEASGGVHLLAQRLLQRSGSDKAGWALCGVGFLLSISIFLDVAFIILIPLLYAVARDSNRSILNYALPTLAGLLVAHAFIPPTPGPIAVTELLGADMGLVILFGCICGAPAAILGGPIFARRFRLRPLEAFLQQPDLQVDVGGHKSERLAGRHMAAFGFAETFTLIVVPLVLIIIGTVAAQLLPASLLLSTLIFLGHPFTALTLTCLAAFILLRTKGASDEQVVQCMTRALEPAGIVVLVTGAGGAFKQVLTDSGAGLVLANMIVDAGTLPIIFAFLIALLVRISQGSATVAMITTAGLVAPMLPGLGLGEVHLALMVVAIAAGASACSHVNDSGFWLVSRYLQLDTKETLKTWSILSTIVGVTGFAMALVLTLLL